MVDMRNNQVWDEEATAKAGVPGVLVENNEMLEKVLTNKKVDGGWLDRDGSLAAAEAVQAATDERRDKEVKLGHRQNSTSYRSFSSVLGLL